MRAAQRGDGLRSGHRFAPDVDDLFGLLLDYTGLAMNAAARPRLAVSAVLVFLAGQTALDQPGLCPCWLTGDLADFHPHPGGYPECPHSHAHLFAMFLSGTAAFLAPALLPAASLILALALAARWRRLAGLSWRAWSWLAPPLTPPARESAG